jgi:Uncharacterized protein encoded in toxicity protection region of plasmid R478, contains von Willebrand factor (vWF) domain
MTDFEQEPFGGGGADEFVDNPEPRCPVVLLLDTSLSMQGPKIDALNAGLLHFHEELSMDPLAMKRVEVAVVTFGPVAVQSDYVSAEHFDPPTLGGLRQHADGRRDPARDSTCCASASRSIASPGSLPTGPGCS